MTRAQIVFATTLIAGISIAAASLQRATTPAPTGAATGTTAKAVSAANAFLATLGDSERAKALFPFNSGQKTNWSNLPSGIYQRNSLKLGDVTPAQRDAAMALMAVVLSREGYQKITDIMNGDEVLRNAGGGRTGGRQAGGPQGDGRNGGRAGGGPPADGRGAPAGGGGGGGRGGGRGGGVQFGLAEYYIGILGTPSATTPWMVQFGGHHLAINITIVGGNNVMTPSLPAAQPARYMLSGQSIRPLGDENDKGFALINALDDAQKKQAILNYQVNDLVLGAGQDGKVIQPEGILASALTTAQQSMLLDLAHEWVGILNDEGATARMAEVRSNLGRTYFAWSGPTTNGSVAYFRIQGPTVLIEYAPQQGDIDHIHTIYRDPTNDYGAKLVTP
jgi:hypothetical protein